MVFVYYPYMKENIYQITIQQVKAARALLDWKQSDLAEACHLSLTAINNLERGIGSPRVETINGIRAALEEAGIEFTEGEGVRKRGEIVEVKIFEGPRFITLMNDYALPFLRVAGEGLMCGINERKFVDYGKDEVKRYDDFVNQNKIVERLIIRENDTYILSQPSAYRWVQEGLIGKVPYMIYGEIFILIMWDIKKVICIRNLSLTDSFHRQFEFLWSLGKALPNNIKSILSDPGFYK